MSELRGRLESNYQEVVGAGYTRPVPEPSEQRADALNNKAVSLFSLSKTQEAFETWRKALDYDSGHCETIYNSAIARWRLGEIDRFEVLRRLQQVKSHRGQAALYEGFFWLELCQPEEAVRALSEALLDERVAENGLAHRALGDASMYLTRFWAAERAYRVAEERMPDDNGTIDRKRMATIGRRKLRGRHVFPSAEPCYRFRRPDTELQLLGGPRAPSATVRYEDRLETYNLDEGSVAWTLETEGSWMGRASNWLFWSEGVVDAEKGVGSSTPYLPSRPPI